MSMRSVRPLRLHTASRLHRLIRFLEGRGPLRCRMGAAWACAVPCAIPRSPSFAPTGSLTTSQAALDAAAKQGAVVAHPPLELPGKGTFAIYIQGEVDYGLRQL